METLHCMQASQQRSQCQGEIHNLFWIEAQLQPKYNTRSMWKIHYVKIQEGLYLLQAL